MARLHIREQVGLNLYSVVVHSPAPAGNNSAAVPWATVIQNSGTASTSLTIGNGPGQITQAEANQVANGSVIETQFQWGDDPAWTAPQRTADLETRAQQAIAEAVDNLQRRFKWFGFTVT